MERETMPVVRGSIGAVDLVAGQLACSGHERANERGGV